MISPISKGYVLDKPFRVLNQWFSPICAFILFSFSATVSYRSFFDPINRTPIRIAAVTMFLIGLLILFASFRNSNILSLSYSCEKDFIMNQHKLEAHILDLKHSFYLTNVSVAFHFKGAWFEDYFILSNQPMPRLPYLDDAGLQVIEKLWKQGVIILPVNEETRTWIVHTTGINHVPLYPKVAYVQRNTV